MTTIAPTAPTAALHTQGLDVLADALDRNGHQYDVENTGGNVMALTIRLYDDTLWAITGDRVDSYTVGRYDSRVWINDDPMGRTDPDRLEHGLTRPDVLDVIDGRRDLAAY